MLENGPWFIRNNSLILKKWYPDENLLKEDVSTVPVWFKLHGVPVTAFSKDGLSAIATKLGTPLILDSYTSDMCIQSWGRSSYARVMIELRADVELIDFIAVYGSCHAGHPSPRETKMPDPRCERISFLYGPRLESGLSRFRSFLFALGTPVVDIEHADIEALYSQLLKHNLLLSVARPRERDMYFLSLLKTLVCGDGLREITCLRAFFWVLFGRLVFRIQSSAILNGFLS
ncbi:putative reverse transcriptase domain-containing protein [Tanacetum coccineum]